MLKNFKIKF